MLTSVSPPPSTLSGMSIRARRCLDWNRPVTNTIDIIRNGLIQPIEADNVLWFRMSQIPQRFRLGRARLSVICRQDVRYFQPLIHVDVTVDFRTGHKCGHLIFFIRHDCHFSRFVPSLHDFWKQMGTGTHSTYIYNNTFVCQIIDFGSGLFQNIGDFHMFLLNWRGTTLATSHHE